MSRKSIRSAFDVVRAEAAVDASALNEEVEAKIDANAKPDYGLHAKCRLSVLADDVDPAQARVCGL